MITSIELKNWKTHRDSTLDFSKGTNILIGQMGAGKSSVMDGISFALFGTFPSLTHKKLKVGRVITSRPKRMDEASVKLEFTVGGDVYTVKRTFTGDGEAKASFEKNGAYVQSQPQRVTEEITKVLKVDYDLFSKAIYSEQNGLDYFLSLSSGDRKKQMDRLLGLDKFAAAYENAGSLANKIKDLVEGSQEAVEAFDMDKAAKQITALTKEMKDAQKELAEMDRDLKKLKEEEKSADAGLKELKELNARKITLTKEVAELASKRKFLQVEIKKMQARDLGDRKEAERKMKEVSKRLSDSRELEKKATDAEREAQKRAAKHESDASNAKKDIDEKEKLAKRLKDMDRKALEKRLEEHTAALQEAQKSMAASQSSKKENEKWVSALKKHISKCPVCERDLTQEMIDKLLKSKDAEIREAEKSIAELESKSTRIAADIEKARKEINEASLVSSKIDSFGEADSRLKVASDALAKAQKEHEKAKSERDSAVDASAKLAEELAQIKSNMELIDKLEEYVKQERDIGSDIEKKERSLDGIKVTDKDIETSQGKSTVIKTSISGLAARIDAGDKLVRDREKQIDEKKEEVERIEKLQKDVERKKSAADNLAKFRNAVEEAQVQMRSRLISAINDTMQDIWPELYPYGDYTGIMLDATADDYVLKVRTVIDGTENWESVEAIASGGERSIGCLAMRVAFALVLVPNLKWLILDEPTHNIDREGLEKFVQVFNEKLPKIVDQVFIITHDEMLKQVSTAKIYLLNRNKEEAGATEVREL